MFVGMASYCCGILLGYFIAQAALKNVGLHKDTLIDIIFYSAILVLAVDCICYFPMAILHGKSRRDT